MPVPHRPGVGRYGDWTRRFGGRLLRRQHFEFGPLRRDHHPLDARWNLLTRRLVTERADPGRQRLLYASRAGAGLDVVGAAVAHHGELDKITAAGFAVVRDLDGVGLQDTNRALARSPGRR